MIVKNTASLARFAPAKMGKVTIAQGSGLLAGLNCFEPGQEHAPHTHAGQDKLYVVLEGSGEIQIGDRRESVTAGDSAFAASGVLHSIRNPGPNRLVVMAILAPPPAN